MDIETTAGALSRQVFPDTNPLTTLCQVAVTCLAKENQGPHGPYSASIQCFKQMLSSEGMSAWNKLRFVSGGRVQAVIAASMGVIYVVTENGSSDRGSKYVMLDVSKLEALVKLATHSNGTSSSNACLQYNNSPTSVTSIATTSAAKTSSERSQLHSSSSQDASEASQTPRTHSIIADDDTEALRIAVLATCVYSSTNYTARMNTPASLPNYAQSKLRDLRYKAALILAATQAGPLGAHSLRGSEIGNALLRLDKDGWNVLPAKGKLQSLEDGCLVLKPHGGNVALVLDVDALQQQAADNVASEVNSLVSQDVRTYTRIKVPDAFKLVLVPPTERAAVARVIPADGIADGRAEPITTDVDERDETVLSSAPNDEWAIAMVTACISLWWPANPITAAIALAIVSQPERIARMRGGREISRPEFIEKDAQRFAMMSGYNLPRGQTPRSIVQACDLMSIADVSGEELIVLDVKGIARRVLEAAAGKQKALANSNQTNAAWPPRKFSDLPVACMHNQAQSAVRYVLNMLAMPDSSDTKEDFMDAVLSQLAEIAGMQTDVRASNNSQTAEKTPCLPLYKVMQQAQAVHESDRSRSVSERQLICEATMHLATAQSEEGPLGKHSMTCKELCQCLMIEDANLWTSWCSSRQEATEDDKVAALVQGAAGIYVTDVPTANNTLIKCVQLAPEDLAKAFQAININRQHSMAGHASALWPASTHDDLSFFGTPLPRQSLHVSKSTYFAQAHGSDAASTASASDAGVNHAGNNEDSSMCTMTVSQVSQQPPPLNQGGHAAASSQPQIMSYQRALGAAAAPEAPSTNISRPAAPRNSRAEACQLAGLCFPCKDNLAVCRRLAVQILAAATPEPPSTFGAYCLRVSVVAAELLHRVPAIYKTKSDPTPWKVSIQQVLENCPVFNKHFNMPSDLWMQLNWKALRQFAASGGFKQPEPAEGPENCCIPTSHADEQHAMYEHSNKQEDKSTAHETSVHDTTDTQLEDAETVDAELPVSHTPDQLKGFAEKLYPRQDPLHKLKLHAVFSLASFNQRHIIPGKRGDDDNLNYYMPGPKLGVAMQELPEWSKLPTPKIAKLVEGDPYIRAIRANGNIMIHLMAWLLVRNAVKAGLPGAEPPPPPPPRALKSAPHANTSTSHGYPTKQNSSHKYPPEWHKNPEKLVQLAEKAYPASDPYKPMKLHAVMVLASCHKHMMPGPPVGFRMSQAFPREWSELPTPRLQTFCQGDKFMRIVTMGDNQGLQLDVAALLQASVQSAETASVTGSHVSNTTAQPNSARSSISGVTSTSTGYSRAPAATRQQSSAKKGHEHGSGDQHNVGKQPFPAENVHHGNGVPASANVSTTTHNHFYHQHGDMDLKHISDQMHSALPSATIRIVSSKVTMQPAKDTAGYHVADWKAPGYPADNNIYPVEACPPGVQTHCNPYDMPSIFPSHNQSHGFMQPQQVAPASFFGRSPPPGFSAPSYTGNSYLAGQQLVADRSVSYNMAHGMSTAPGMHAVNGLESHHNVRHGMMGGGYGKETSFHGPSIPGGLLQQFNNEYANPADDDVFGKHVEKDLLDLLLSD